MREDKYMVLAKRQQQNGKELWLIETDKGEKRLWIPLAMGKDKNRLEVSRRLKETINPDAVIVEGFYPLLDAVSYQDWLMLEIRYEEALWEGWEAGLPQKAEPESIADWLMILFGLESSLIETGQTLGCIHPESLLPLINGEIGLLDPRIHQVISQSQPLTPPQEFFYSPEALRGKPWTSASTWYSAGLSAYIAATGVFPFGDGGKAEVTQRIMDEKPLDIRYLAPAVSETLANLLGKMLEKDAVHRPSTAEIGRILGEIKEKGARADVQEQKAFADKSQQVVEQREKVRRFKGFWRIGRWGVFALGLIILGILWSKPGYKPILTPETPPGQVVDYYYKALAELDAMRLDEMLAKGVGKDVEQMVTWGFVISRYDPTGEPRTVLKMKELKVQSVIETPSVAKYSAEYTLEIYSAKVKKTQLRFDNLTLKRVEKVWQIVGLDSKVVSEKEEPWTDEPKDPRVDKPDGLR